MTPIATRILAIAAEHAEYPGARQTTLRGQGIVDAVLHCFTDECLADLLKLRAEESDLKSGPHYSPPGTTSSAAASKERAS